MNFTNTQLVEAYQNLPRPIREYLAGEELGSMTMKLGQEFQLHVDAEGKLSEIITYTLLGFISPKDLPDTLARDLNLTREQVTELIKQINEKIFVPLQKKVRALTEEDLEDDAQRFDENEPKAPASQPDPVPVMRVGENAPVPTAPPVSGTWPAPPAPVTTTPATEAPAPIYSSVAPSPQVQVPYMRTMATDMQFASHGMQGQAVSPARSFQTASVPITQAPQMPQAAPEIPPTVPPIHAEPAYPPPPMASVRLTPVDPTRNSTPITKEYGSDPYREPIEQ